ncbi:hypothetical protein CO650_19565 [Rhizobium phaseoli]|nr:hypothetical protein CO650_19565 [Rhizobium phaseoli]
MGGRRRLWRGDIWGLGSPPAPHPPAGTFSPLAGRRGQAATSPSLANVSQGTSPRPVYRGPKDGSRPAARPRQGLG